VPESADDRGPELRLNPELSDPGVAYWRAWTRLRNGRLLIVTALLSWLPLNVLLSRVLSEGTALWVTGPLAAAGMWGGAILIGSTRCPSCRELFTFSNTGGRHPFASRCVWCGVQQWSGAQETVQHRRPSDELGAAQQGDEADER
jgi:hypothetical protein